MPPKTNDPDIKGIIATDALRISDFADAFNDVREVLVCISQFVAVLTPESTLESARAISNMPDFTTNANIALDKAMDEQKKIHKKTGNLKKLELELDKILNFTKHRQTNIAQGKYFKISYKSNITQELYRNRTEQFTSKERFGIA